MKKLNKKQKLIGFIAILLVAIILAIIITTNIVSNNGVGSVGYATTANAGSTLVANYIKKGITIGGITGTLESLNTFDATARPEDVAWGKTCYVKGEKITGTRRTIDMLEIGDYVDYTPDSASDYYLSSTYSGYSSDQTISQNTNLKWRILGINNDGTVDLISNTYENRNSINLTRAKGYNNGVYLLNDISKQLYSNKELNGIGRSINLNDIEKHYNEDGIEYRDSYISDAGIKYGETKSYDISKSYYPNLYAQENGSGINTTQVKNNGIEKDDPYYYSATLDEYSQASISGLTVTQTFYIIPTESKYYDNVTFFNMINSGLYYIASRWVSCNYIQDIEMAEFGICSYRNTGELFLSRQNGGVGSVSGFSFRTYLRPVVTLQSSIKVTGGSGTSSSQYQISK